METFEKLAKKSRNRLVKRTIGSSVLVILVIAGLFWGRKSYLEHQLSLHTQEVVNYYHIREGIAYPNLHSSGTILATNQYSYLYQLKRSKNINGIVVPYDTVEAAASASKSKLDQTADSASLQGGLAGKPVIAFSNQGVKIPLFYNISNKDDLETFAKPSHELGYLSQMPNQLVEVALSFDKPYTYQELQEKIPTNLKQNWFWFGTYSQYNTASLPISNLFGLTLMKEDLSYSLERFREYLTQEMASHQLPLIIETSKGEVYNTDRELARLNREFKNVKDCKFYGVILTGRAEDFATLQGKDWIFASSIGAVIENRPYYPLEKE